MVERWVVAPETQDRYLSLVPLMENSMDQGDYHLWVAIGYTAGVIVLLGGVLIICGISVLKKMCDDANDH